MASSAKRFQILCAFDKFKGSLDAQGVCRAVAKGILSGTNTPANVIEVPLSDGGDGFVSVLASKLSMKTRTLSDIVGPMGDRQPRIEAHYASSPDHSLAVLEMAAASGLALVPAGMPLDVANATTFGVGQMLRVVYQRGARQIILGLGGSATNDGGLGALQALGLRINLKSQARPLSSDRGEYACGRMMQDIESIDLPDGGFLPDLKLVLACDVTNPFLGPRGAVAVFSPQKGATDPLLREELEKGMANAAFFYNIFSPRNISELPGAGAAGGLAGGLVALLKAEILSGMDIVTRYLNLEEQIANAHLIITGEGRFDASTDDGKVVSRVMELCEKHKKPLVIVCGASTHPSPSSPVYPLLSMFDLDTSLTQTASCLEQLSNKHIKHWMKHTPTRIDS